MAIASSNRSTTSSVTFAACSQQNATSAGRRTRSGRRCSAWLVDRRASCARYRRRFGFNPDTRFTVAEVGPGFTSFDEQGPDAVDTPRRAGAYYEENLRLAVASGRKIMAIETWNELDEGTGILETREFGRQYIELTRRYADLFKRGDQAGSAGASSKNRSSG